MCKILEFKRTLNNLLQFKPLSQKTNITVLLGLVLFLLPIIAYIPATYCGIIWDDDAIVFNNLLLRSLEGLRKIWFEPGAMLQYYPLVHTTYWLEYHFWGLNPSQYHLLNIILHALNSVLIWFILRKLSVPGGWLAAAIFALHPVHVESVAWITERKNVLSGLFYLTSLFCAIRYWLFNQNLSKHKQKYYYVISFILFVCALHSKTVTFSLPAIILLLVYWKKGKISIAKDVAPLTPFLFAGLMMSFLTVFLEKHVVGARGSDLAFSFFEKAMIAGRVFWFYLGKLLWPVDLSFIYPRWRIDETALLQYVYPFSALFLILTLWIFRKKIGGVFAGFLFFVITLIPASGFFNVYPMRFSFVADHFQYLASIGPIAIAAACITKFSGLLKSNHIKTIHQSKAPHIAMALLVIFTLGSLTWNQCFIYKNVITLWGDVLSKNPESSVAHTNYASALQSLGDGEGAKTYNEHLLTLDPNNEVANYSLSLIEQRNGQNDKAIVYAKRAFYASYDKGNQSLILNTIGLALIGQNKVKEAISHFCEAIRLDSNNSYALNNLAKALDLPESKDEAMSKYPEILRLNPEHLLVKHS